MKFKSEVELLDVKPRTDKPAAEGEPGPPGFYIKVGGEMPIEELAGLYSTEDSYNRLLASLYRKSGELETLDLAQSNLSTGGINLKVTVKTAFGEAMEFKGAEMDGIKITPVANRMAHFKARLKLVKPTDEQMAAILRAQHQGITLKVSGKTLVSEAEDDGQGEMDVKPGGRSAPVEDDDEREEQPGMH